MNLVSPIRYFGGKNVMGKRIVEYFPDITSYKTYIEPFGGSGALFFKKEPSTIEIYNDLEENVYSLFKVLVDKELFAEFKQLCDLTPYSAQLREEYKKDLKSKELSLLDRAYRYFFINRCSINGTGGFSSSFLVRRKMSYSTSQYLGAVDKLTEVHQRLSRVIVHKMDAFKIIPKYDKKDVFFYMDPPYHQSTRGNMRYDFDMGDGKQSEFIDMLLGLENARVLLSGYDNEEGDRLMENGWKKSSFTLARGGNTARVGTDSVTEVIWMNY